MCTQQRVGLPTQTTCTRCLPLCLSQSTPAERLGLPGMMHGVLHGAVVGGCTHMAPTSAWPAHPLYQHFGPQSVRGHNKQNHSHSMGSPVSWLNNTLRQTLCGGVTTPRASHSTMLLLAYTSTSQPAKPSPTPKSLLLVTPQVPRSPLQPLTHYCMMPLWILTRSVMYKRHALLWPLLPSYTLL